MNVLVTGGEGFIGSRLLSMNDCGITFGSLDKKSGEDFMDEDTLIDFLGVSDAVVHLAAVSNGPDTDADPVAAFQTNVAGTALVAKNCDEFGIPMILASSAAVYGDSIYGITKRQAEEAAGCFLKHKLLIARIFNVYDETFEQRGVIGKFLTESEKSGTITIHGKGDQIRDFVHADDLCRFFIHVLKNWNDLGGIVNFGTGKGTSIRKLANFIAKATDSTIVEDPRQGAGIKESISTGRSFSDKFNFSLKKTDVFRTVSEALG
jgi:UDP-glucose 4-epimerase